MKKMTKEQISEFNQKVEYNQSAASWIIDIIGCIIFLPMIAMVLYRRGKYSQKIEVVDDETGNNI